MSIRRIAIVVAFMSAFAISFAAPLSGTAYACDPGTGGDCYKP